MTSQNEDAEELMRRIEKEEERVGFSDPEKQVFHLCIYLMISKHMLFLFKFLYCEELYKFMYCEESFSKR